MKQSKKMPLEEASPPKRPYGGRPSLKEAEQLHDRILDAAAELFAKRGYGETSIEAIAAHAGIGKLTLYRRFADKDALFQAVAIRMSEQRRAEMAKIGEGEGSLSDVLTAVGRRLLDIVLSPESIAFHRIVFADAARLPELCARMYQETPPDASNPVRAIFGRFADDGSLRVGDVNLLDQQFIQAIIGQPLLQTLLGGPAMGEREREKHVRKAVDLFLNGAAK
ncbi:MAG: hypothetical protein FD176_2132 [Rhodospirillaceae bacterium]|nr:MAG: hypothetical protein FD176_2132 [Rhodospirillaceae bacterium]TNC96905.1 MAG: hypothetical protein FD119_1411 [Stygiobacter sp.]